jgi:hypothetical protein
MLKLVYDYHHPSRRGEVVQTPVAIMLTTKFTVIMNMLYLLGDIYSNSVYEVTRSSTE